MRSDIIRFALLLAFAWLAPAGICAKGLGRERLEFNADWRFAKGDPAGMGDQLAYAQVRDWLLASAADFSDPLRSRPARPPGRLGHEISHVQPGFDDSGWRQLNLPHDWGIEGPFAQENPPETGKLPWWGVGWYRKRFVLPETDQERRISLEIDGAMSHAMVWLNGEFVGGWPYGYASWQLDLTPYLRFGGENVLVIRLDNPPNSSRWYPGGGIYRNVWLVKTSAVHVAHWGTFVTTPRVRPEAAVLAIEVKVQNDTVQPQQVTVSTEIYACDQAGRRTGRPVATFDPVHVSVAGGRQALAAQGGTVAQPALWSIAAPARYVARTIVSGEAGVLDDYQTTFGIRTAEFDAERGFLLNGESVRLQGVCLHHDLGALGAALHGRALERQLEILQAMGCNALRTTHNPPAPELLDLADRMGFVVIDEAFDCWAIAKKPNDYHRLFADWHGADLRALVRRDRNHPSVVLWSIGNEIKEQGEPEGWKVAAALAAIVRSEDRTRLVTVGCNQVQSGYNGFQAAVDVLGYNYKPAEYGPFHARSPHIPVLGSETASCVSSRGEYFFPVSEDKAAGRADFHVSSYDLYAPRWAWPPDVEFRGLDDAPFAAGEFVWTGFDYLGEPTPYNADATNLLNFTDPGQRARAATELAALDRIRVPSRSSYFGIVDLAGFPKDRYYLYQARWRPDHPMVHVLPHWNWPEREGLVTPVHVYTSGDEAELFLNGRSLGRKKRGPRDYRLRWDEVLYTPGEVRVVAYKGGVKWAETVTRTTGPAARLLLTMDRATLQADGKDLAFVTVTVADADSRMVPRAHHRVQFTVSGPADLVATDNGDPTSFEPFQTPSRKAFNGKALAILRTRVGQPGSIVVRAVSEGLEPAELTLRSQ